MTKIDHQMPQEISTRVKGEKMHFGSGQTHLHSTHTIRLVVPVNAHLLAPCLPRQGEDNEVLCKVMAQLPASKPCIRHRFQPSGTEEMHIDMSEILHKA
jgi:hypothetical protein